MPSEHDVAAIADRHAGDWARSVEARAEAIVARIVAALDMTEDAEPQDGGRGTRQWTGPSPDFLFDYCLEWEPPAAISLLILCYDFGRVWGMPWPLFTIHLDEERFAPHDLPDAISSWYSFPPPPDRDVLRHGLVRIDAALDGYLAYLAERSGWPIVAAFLRHDPHHNDPTS